MTPTHVSWPSIGLFHHIRQTIDFLVESGQPVPAFSYRGKVKLHGTNAAIQCTEFGPFAQSRSKIIFPTDDNCGFARWLADNSETFPPSLAGLTIFGEWCGKGVQKGTAISAIDRKIFAVFAVQESPAGSAEDEDAELEVCPERIRERLPDHPDLFVIPWHGLSVRFDFSSDLAEPLEAVNKMVASIEEQDPWVSSTFDVAGIGEGLVMYPSTERIEREHLKRFAFKAKGEKHRASKTKKAAQIGPEVAASIAGFVELQVTEARLEQGLAEGCGGEVSVKRIGDFLRWISKDLIKESELELAAAELTWKQVQRDCTKSARDWFLARCAR